MQFSEDYNYLIRYWSRTKGAESLLAAILTSCLREIERRLKAFPWWCDHWSLRRESDQLLISRDDLCMEEVRIMQLGVTGFNAEGIFGTKATCRLFVRSWDSRDLPEIKLRDLVNGLSQSLEVGRGRTNYDETLTASMDDRIERFEDSVMKPVVGFFNLWGPSLES